ncbi:MAG TPA: DUF4157 domain-containing protein, partial [Kofleriaceae bacterium]
MSSARKETPQRTPSAEKGVEKEAKVQKRTAGSAVEALDALKRSPGALDAAGVIALQKAVGNRAVSGMVQSKGVQRVEAEQGSEMVHEAAKVGIGGSGGKLPYLDKVQQAFGGHDLSNVVAHTGAQATAGAQAMGALAFTTGNHVSFAGTPSLHTVAHEAAHVVQQRNGVQLTGGVGQAGDRYERHADQVARRVVQGQSAEPLLGSAIATRRAAPALTQQEGAATPAGLSPGVIQRLTGFEVETRIPVYNRANDGKDHVRQVEQWQPEIGWFLFSGMEYGYVGSDAGGRFALHADHNEIQKGVNFVRSALVAAGMLKDETPLRNMSNLEYVSPPRDELAPGVAHVLKEDREAMTRHMALAFGLAKSDGTSRIPGTSSTLLTGVPSKAILAWVQANGGHDAYVKLMLQALEKLITTQVYIQQTTGVLPEDIPALYESSSKQMGPSESTRDKAMVALMQLSLTLATDAMQAIPEPPAVIEKSGRGVFGVLALTASRLLADSLSFTDFSEMPKNLFPHLPKAPSFLTFAALPAEVLAEDAFWKTALTALARKAEAFPPAFWEKFGFQPVKSREQSQLYEDKPGSHAKALAALLKNVGGEATLEGELKPNLGLDEPHPERAKATGQLGIPLEDRYFGAKLGKVPQIEDVGEALAKGTSEAQELLKPHVDPSVLAETSREPKGLEAAAWLRFQALSTRLAGHKLALEISAKDLGEQAQVSRQYAEEDFQEANEARDKYQAIQEELEQRKEELQRAELRLRQIEDVGEALAKGTSEAQELLKPHVDPSVLAETSREPKG